MNGYNLQLCAGYRATPTMSDLKTTSNSSSRKRCAPSCRAHADTPAALERPKQATHGDYASNIALSLAKRAQRNPRELAQALVAALPASKLIERAEIAGPGFINFFVTPAARQAIVARVLKERDAFGRSAAHAGERVMVEFVSANPTGPLHVGHGRQAALGDAIASLFESQGYAVTREFYYNDAGQQIENLGHFRPRARAGAAGAADHVSRRRLSRRVHPGTGAALPGRSAAMT